MVLKRIGVLSCGKIVGSLYGFLGLIFGGIFALFSILGAGIASFQSEGPEALLGGLFGVGAVILLPLLYGTIGFVGGLLMSFLYNLLAGWVGGIEVELE